MDDLAHILELLDERRRGDERFHAERDRRYMEILDERDKRRMVKELAEAEALHIAREIQIYKDEQANKLREQINAERGSYATKEDLQKTIREWSATVKPALDFVARENGARATMLDIRSVVLAVTAIGVALIVGHPWG